MKQKPNTFQKGNPGGPGRPRGSISLTTALRENLTRADAEAIVRKLISMAKQGNTRALEIIWNRLDGCAPQVVDLNLGGRIDLGEIAINADDATLARMINARAHSRAGGDKR